MSTDGEPHGTTTLIEWHAGGGASDAAAPLQAAVAELAASLGSAATGLYQEVEGTLVTAYFASTRAAEERSEVAIAAQRLLSPFAAGEVLVRQLAPRLSVAGASAGDDAPFRYVVHTDVAAGGAAELERWYDEEHMPGLAAVPGTVLAQRMICLDRTPPYFACYDLVAPEVLGSPEWLAVRGTPWSDRVRPTFRNTRRFMSRRLDRPA